MAFSEEKGYINAVYKCTPHRRIDDKNRCFLPSANIFRQIQNREYTNTRCFSRVSFSRETEKQVICPGGFPVVGFLLTPFTPIQVGTYRQPLPNIFVWEKSAEACTTKNREISNKRRLYCLDALAARQTLYKLAFRRKKCIAWL